MLGPREPASDALKLASAYTGTSNATKNAQMDTCLEETKTWLDLVHQKYTLCKNATVHETKTVECNMERGVALDIFVCI